MIRAARHMAARIMVRTRMPCAERKAAPARRKLVA
jgi:hypothetical protein